MISGGPLGFVASLRGAVSPPRLARVPREDLSLLIAERPGGVTGNGLLGGGGGGDDWTEPLLSCALSIQAGGLIH